jgi:hypothetical protein
VWTATNGFSLLLERGIPTPSRPTRARSRAASLSGRVLASLNGGAPILASAAAAGYQSRLLGTATTVGTDLVLVTNWEQNMTSTAVFATVVAGREHRASASGRVY